MCTTHVYSSSEKGVAILVNKARHPNFRPDSQKVDRNGRYVVVQGKLGEQGQDYTLVSVYNHQEDTTTLDLLTPYLQDKAVGTLVIGGDFNTTLGINDQAKIIPPSQELQRYGPNETNPQHERIRKFVVNFMRSLQLVDVFRGQNGYGRFDETCFTYKRNEGNLARLSRLDYIFIPEEWTGSVTICETVGEINMDLQALQEHHYPLLLKLDPNPLPPSQFYNFTAPHIPQNITEVEIAAAIQSLKLRDKPDRPGRPLSKYRNFNPEEIKQLKRNFDHYINTKSLPANFNYATYICGHYFFNVEYLIFANILAWRLEDWSREEESSQQADIEDWSQLQTYIGIILNGHSHTSDFDIIEKMLINETTNRTRLHKGCPLSRTLQKLFPKLGYTE